MKESVAVKRLGEVEELANLATYVVSDYASWLTAESIVYDGGQLSNMSGMFNELSQVLLRSIKLCLLTNCRLT